MTQQLRNLGLLIVTLGLVGLIVIVFGVTLPALKGISSIPATSSESAYPALPTETQMPAVTRTPDLDATRAFLKTRIAALEMTMTTYPSPERPVGICDCVDLGMLKMNYNLLNSWQRQIDGHWARVEAGSLKDDPTQGILAEAWEGVGGADILIPGKTGPVRIIAENNNRLTVQPANGGDLLYFDVPGFALVSSLSEVVPTITPRPSDTPVPPTPLQPTAYP